MTWTTRILSILNVLAVFALFWLAAQSWYLRNLTSQALKAQEQLRDGIPTEDWFQMLTPDQRTALVDKIKIDDQLISRLSQADRDALKIRDRAKEDSDAADKSRGQKPPHRSEFDQEQRREMAMTAGGYHLDFDPKNNPTNLAGVQVSPMREVALRLGPAGFRRLVQEAIRLHQPRLAAEERDLIDRKASLLRIKAEYERDIEKLKEQIAALSERADAERAIRDRALHENTERRRELATLYTELEEAILAREVALGLEMDARRQLEEIQERMANYLKLNEALTRQIQQSELGTATKE
jgi:hypothetical protein